MRLLVTGASGFIGGVLCRQLLEAGHEVHALVRRPGSEPAGTTPVRGDIGDAALLTEVLASSRPDCVVHLAAEIASQRSEERVMQVNVAGTEHLIAACLSLGEGNGAAPRVVFASTVVTGDAHGALLTEDTALPVRTPYGRAKQEGERLLLSSGLDVSIIRPSHVYGPGGWYAHELVPRLKGPGRFAVVGRGANLWDVVHVEDVAAALALAASAAESGSIFHVVDDQPITYYDFMALTAATLGVGAPRRIPAAVVRMIAGRNAVDALVRSARSSNARIKQELGWHPRFATATEGVPDALRALRVAAG